jgi:acyl-coenzyme A thioesterase PaaI-like protein
VSLDLADVAPAPAPDATWVPVNPFPFDGSAVRSFVSGTGGGGRMRIAYYRHPDGDHLYSLAWFGPRTEGPPRSVHGGATAAVLDEAMGGACWMNGHRVVAARLTVNYRHLVPLGFDGRVDAWIDAIDRRKITTRARLTDLAGKVYAESEGLFIELLPEALDAFRR